MQKRINVTLPEETIDLLERLAPKGNRSRLIDRAVREYVRKSSRAEIRKRLKAGYLRDRDSSMALAADWFPLEEEAWAGLGEK